MKLTSPEKSQECYEAGIRIDTLRGEIDWGRNRNRASLDEWLDWFHEKLKSNDRKRKYVLVCIHIRIGFIFWVHRFPGRY